MTADPLVVVVGAGTPLAGGIADRLGARGAAVLDLAAADRPDALVAATRERAGDRAVAAVLHAGLAPASAAPLAELTPEVWRDRCARPIDAALATARAGFELMATGDDRGPRSGRGGTLGFLCPTVAITGAAGHVALAAAGEAIRLLAKSAARRWGRFGITSNAFAVRLDDVPGTEGLQVHASALDPASVDPADDVAALLLHLAGPGGARLTGATLAADGGELMAP